tara:strand:- start:58237 stop:59658 length:1422 start_codon:yes stop_codon:yes gene_type:complete
LTNDHKEGQVGRPGSMDVSGSRIFQHPSAVTGYFRIRRDIVYSVLIVFFLVLPWVKINGQQAVLFNLPERQFSLFGLHLWAHDTPLVFFILAFLVMGLAFVTSIWGRVWCGWACPQTVFIDGVFRRIEAWVEGNHLARRKLDSQPLNGEKIKKRTIKWVLFFIVSFFISHSFVAYFVGAEAVIEYIQGSPKDHWATFLFVMALTALILFDFGWFREQFCIVMCPYGRFQSVLMDQGSLAVLYDEERGEPRGKKNRDSSTGDCIDCGICVRACPTGIDIRNGVQMECIACTACIDACDEVMEKVKKPKGLIRYSSELELNQKSKSRPKSFGRIFVYLTLLTASIVGFAYNLTERHDLDVQFIRSIETPFSVVESDKGESEVINHFKIHLQNQTYELLVADLELTSMVRGDVVKPEFPVQINPGSKAKSQFFVRFDPKVLGKNGGAKVPILLKYKKKGQVETVVKEIQLIGPLQQ